MAFPHKACWIVIYSAFCWSRFWGGAETVTDALPALIAEAQRQYFLNCPPDLRERVCPGVVSFLDSLKQAGLPCAIVSGNLRAIGWKKLELAALRSYFSTGAFAEDGATRAHLVRAVLNEVLGGPASSFGAVSLIGDHSNDIRRAGKRHSRNCCRYRTIVFRRVARKESPDLLFEDLTTASVRHVL